MARKEPGPTQVLFPEFVPLVRLPSSRRAGGLSKITWPLGSDLDPYMLCPYITNTSHASPWETLHTQHDLWREERVHGF